MARTIEPAPAEIVRGGELLTGLFDAPVRNMNFAAEDCGGPAMRLLRRTRLKEWIGFGVIHPNRYFTFFALDAKYAGAGVFNMFRRPAGPSFNRTVAAPGIASLAPTMHEGVSSIAAPGYYLEVRHFLSDGCHTIKADILGDYLRPRVRADITVYEDAAEIKPITAAFPLDGGGFMYTHKSPMPAEGRVLIGNSETILDPARDIAILDEHRSLLPFRTSWRWGTFAGRDPQGRITALNIGTHDTISDEAAHNENCIWRGSEMTLLGPAEFSMSQAFPMRPWKIRTDGGGADVVFFPEGKGGARVELGVAGMNYKQYCGRYRGALVDCNGERIEVRDWYGVAESMDARF